MSAFYNDIDPKACAWTRQLIALIQARLGCTSSGRLTYGTLGKAPKPFRAKCNSLNSAIGHFALFRVYERFLRRDLPRSFHMREGHLGSISGIVSSLSREAALLLFAFYKSLVGQDSEDTTLGLSSPLCPADKRRNMSIFGFVAKLLEIRRRNFYIYDFLFSLALSLETYFRRPESNNISDDLERLSVLGWLNFRTVGRLFPCGNNS